MTSTISFSFKTSVRDGLLNDAKQLLSEMVEATRGEPGALTYEYFLSDDGRSCHFNERYVDSEAVMQHLSNFGANFAERFMGCFEPTSLSVYGRVSDDARAALDGLGAEYLSTSGGFTR